MARPCRVGAPGDLRAQAGDVELDALVEGGVRVAAQRAPALDRGREGGAARRPRAPLEVGEGRLVGRDHPGARPGLDRHVADGHPPLHRERGQRRAGVLDHRADTPGDADLPDRRQHHVLGGEPGGELAAELDEHRARARLQERLGGEHVLDLGGADPEGEPPKAPWVEVWLSPQTIVIPGWVSPSSGPITWTIPSRPLPVALSGTPNPRSCGRASRAGRGRARRGSAPGSVGTLWSIVAIVSRAGARDGRRAQPLEGLRARDLVDEVEIDVEQRGLRGPLLDHVRLPDPLEEGAPAHSSPPVAG